MPQSPATDGRADPYKNFRFRLRWDGRVVAGVNKVSGLKRTTEVVANRDRGTNDLPAADAGSRFEAITLEQGITVNVEFHRWATAGQARRDVDLEMYNEAGQLALAYTVHRAWVSQYQALPDLDANATAVAIAHIQLEHEG